MPAIHELRMAHAQSKYERPTFIRRRRLWVRILQFQCGETGSSPVGAANYAATFAA